MLKIALFTIVSKNYLSYARVLMSSVAKIHPEYRLFVCLADRVDGYFDATAEPFEVVEAQEIGIPNFLDMTVRYDIMEMNTAVKPFMFHWILRNHDVDAAIYLDPDIQVFSRLDKIEGLLEVGASIVLTPHICRPLEDGKSPNDYNMLQAGVFNLGFMAARNCRDATNFIGWWGRRLETLGGAEFSNNLFTDQKWCDLAPCFVDNLAVLKDPGFNVAYWNLAHREVHRDGLGAWKVAGQPLAFFHFSGVSADKPDMLSKHQNRFDFSTLPQLRPLFDKYRAGLIKAQWDKTKSWPYAYGKLDDSVPLCSIINQLYRIHFPAPQDLPPKRIAEIVLSLCNGPEPGISTASGAPTITRLMYFIYSKRHDLRAAFNLHDGDGGGVVRYSEWFVASAEREYGIPRIFIPPFAPVAEEIISIEGTAPGPQIKIYHAGTTLYRFLVRMDKIILYAIWSRLPKYHQQLTKRYWDKLIAWSLRTPRARAKPAMGGAGGEEKQAINRLAAPANIQQLLPDLDISRLMYLIWTTRPDLQNVFDLRSTQGQQGFVDWFRVSSLREYNIQPQVPEKSSQDAPALGTKEVGPSGSPGANLIGYAHAELGMGEHVRMTAAAMEALKAPFGVLNFNVGVGSRQRAELEHGRLTSKNPHKANIFHINADQMLLAYCHLGDQVFAGKYNIGYWAWELAKCPDAWLPVMELVDEIWAPSRFIQSAFSERTDLPVEYMPLCVELPAFKRLDKGHFGLPRDAFVFLYTFDSFSYFARKNPFDAIRAFQRAFRNSSDNVRLVLKTMNGDEEGQYWKEMLALIGSDTRIIIINRTMDRGEVLALFEAADCFVSLHRSEGFGRGPAEAMYMGKPVIVTNYSGNTDFTLPDNSCLVDYELVPVAEGEYPFHQGQIWAQPDVEQAAWHMCRVWEDAAYRSDIGTKASTYIKDNFNAKVVGRLYVDRLRALGFLG